MVHVWLRARVGEWSKQGQGKTRLEATESVPVCPRFLDVARDDAGHHGARLTEVRRDRRLSRQRKTLRFSALRRYGAGMP